MEANGSTTTKAAERASRDRFLAASVALGAIIRSAGRGIDKDIATTDAIGFADALLAKLNETPARGGEADVVEAVGLLRRVSKWFADGTACPLPQNTLDEIGNILARVP